MFLITGKRDFKSYFRTTKETKRRNDTTNTQVRDTYISITNILYILFDVEQWKMPEQFLDHVTLY